MRSLTFVPGWPVQRIRAEYAGGALTDIDGIRIDYPDWWFNLRVSNTEPLLRLVIEAATEQGLEQKTAELRRRIALYAGTPH